MTGSTRPLVSIVVPVYNEERFIDAALTSLRGQDYPNLEIVISDNASTDATVAICERHAAEDVRIRMEPLSKNIGAPANFRRVADFARGGYLMWGTGHDLWTPRLVYECVDLLERHPEASLAFPSSWWIGPDDEPLSRLTGWSDLRGLDPVARFFTVLWGSMHPMMGVIRTQTLRECTPLTNRLGADLVLLSELALRGYFLHAPGSRWSRREFRDEARYRDKVRRYSSFEMGVSRSRRKGNLALLDLPFALVRVLLRAPLSRIDKAGALVALLASMPIRYIIGRRGSSD